MNITLAASAGYCFGVERAIRLARENAPAYTLGPLIHNADAVRELTGEGIIPVNNAEEIPEGSTVIIRSHGAGEAEINGLSGRFRVIDATCPFVTAIHKTVRAAADRNADVIICGQKEHPEVLGIKGWAGKNAYVVSCEEDVNALPHMDAAEAVAQTTLGSGRYRELCGLIKQKVARLKIHGTVCSATLKRQQEAEALARRSDVMLVVGDRLSSNTRRLYEICKTYCPRSYLIESARALNDIRIDASDIIGITAGASTPCRIYKEVVSLMNNDIETKVSATDDFASAIDQTMVQIHPGQVLTGEVLYINEDEVGVSVGYKMDGLVKKTDLSDKDVKVGDTIEVEVVKVNDGEGNVLLSQKNIINKQVWDGIKAKSEAGEYIDAVAKEAVKGGLICDIEGIRTFVPASQIANRYVEKLDQFVGQPMQLKIIELDDEKKRIVASRKAVLNEQAAAKKEEIWSKLEEGAVVKGIVRRLTDFGAFVDVGGVDGLVHVTNLSWSRVNNPADVVSVGDEIDVKILSLDKEKERISLSRKATLPKPWTTASEKYPVGAIVEGKVVRITTFGAFVTLEDGLDGLVHISQCAPNRIEKVEDAVKVGDIVKVKVLDVDTEKKRISLSIKQALMDEAVENTDEPSITDEYAIDDNANA